MQHHPITDVIRQRRSVKPALMRPDPIPRETIELLLENAVWAPTHGLTEPWRFLVFEGESRRELAGILQEVYRTTTPEASFRPEKLEKLGRNPLLAPVVIVIVMQPDPTGKIPPTEEVAAVACAVQNMHLTAAAIGLGAFWSSPALIYTDTLRGRLGLDQTDHCLGLFYLGWPKDDVALEGRRTPAHQKCSWHSDQTIGHHS